MKKKGKHLWSPVFQNFKDVFLSFASTPNWFRIKYKSSQFCASSIRKCFIMCFGLCTDWAFLDCWLLMGAEFGKPDPTCKDEEQSGLIFLHAHSRAGLCRDSFTLSVAGEETANMAVSLQWPGESWETSVNSDTVKWMHISELWFFDLWFS